MNEPGKFAYIEAKGEALEIPFNRYLPSYPPGTAASWLDRHVSRGSWVLEPIGASPAVIFEMAEAGYKVLVSVNNPITAFELSLLAKAPKDSEFQDVLRELSVQKKGKERLGEHLRGLYLTRCSTCGHEIAVDCFLWRKGESAPYAKRYRCTACGNEGEHPATYEDIDRLQPFKRSDPLHRSRALERLPGGTRAARANAEELIDLYAPRPLYAIFTLINKLEGMDLSPPKRALLDALLLSTLDAGHTLWPVDEVERPRALSTPAEYVEWNIWHVLESAAAAWSCRRKSLRLTHWPEIPEPQGICIYQGRMRDLKQQKPDLQPECVFCVLPHPNQAFWSLATLWTSWLWGKEITVNFKNVLERQRFDWYWHANALQSAIAPAIHMSKKDSPVFCLIPDPSPGFVSSAFEACSTSSLQLAGISLKDEKHPLQTEWTIQTQSREAKKVNLHRIIRESIHNSLNEIGEPVRHLNLYTAANASLAVNEAFPPSIQQLTYETVNEIHGEITKTFNDRKFLRRMEATAQDFDSGTWWLTQPENCQTALADRIETELLNWLQKEIRIKDEMVQQTMNVRFPGLLTPPAELLQYCLRSYADFNPSESTWTLKKNENAEQRAYDLEEIQSLLEKLAARMDFSVEGENPQYWSILSTAYRLFYSSGATMSSILKIPLEEENCETIFLFPGSRSALLRYKLDRDPYLRERTAQRWHFLKFRTLRELAQRSDISRDLWDLLIDSDPISLEDATQLSMFL